MARKGTPVTYYLRDESVEFLHAQAFNLGISKSKAMQMSLDLWKASEDYLLESFGTEVPTTVELLTRMIVAEKKANEKEAVRCVKDTNRLDRLAQLIEIAKEPSEREASHAQA